MTVLRIEYREPHDRDEALDLAEKVEEFEDYLRLRGYRELEPRVQEKAEARWGMIADTPLTFFYKQGYTTVQAAQRLAKKARTLTTDRGFSVLDLTGEVFSLEAEAEDE